MKLRIRSGVLLFSTLCSLWAQSTTPGVQRYLSQLQDPAQSDAAMHQLKELSTADPEARAEVEHALPRLLKTPPSENVGDNELSLVAALKLYNALPTLIELLRTTQPGGPASANKSARLVGDTLGKTLVELGDPAVPALQKLLKSGGSQAQIRAAFVLMNMGSDKSIRALQEFQLEKGGMWHFTKASPDTSARDTSKNTLSALTITVGLQQRG